MDVVETYDRRAAGLVPGSSRLEVLATGCAWSEGPVWMEEDGSVLWSDIPNNRMMCWHPQSGVSVWRDKVDFTNGHAREADGSLLHCSHGKRAIVRTRFTTDLEPIADEVLVDRFQGKRLNSPNDVVVKSDGTIWFTDPPYGILSDHEGYKAESELKANYVFRFDPTTGDLAVASDFVEEPNGLAFSPDFRVDVQGWHYTSSADSVHVYAPDGRRLMKIPAPEKVGNLTFGGPERNQLFICASSSLYRIKHSGTWPAGMRPKNTCVDDATLRPTSCDPSAHKTCRQRFLLRLAH